MKRKCGCTYLSSLFLESLFEFSYIHVVASGFLDTDMILLSSLFLPAAADIPVDRAARLRVELLEDSIAFAVDSADKLKGLFGRAKTALAKLYSQVFPRFPQVPGLEALT